MPGCEALLVDIRHKGLISTSRLLTVKAQTFLWVVCRSSCFHTKEQIVLLLLSDWPLYKQRFLATACMHVSFWSWNLTNLYGLQISTNATSNNLKKYKELNRIVKERELVCGHLKNRFSVFCWWAHLSTAVCPVFATTGEKETHYCFVIGQDDIPWLTSRYTIKYVCFKTEDFDGSSLSLNNLLNPEPFQFLHPECDQRARVEAHGSAQGYSPARSTNSPCAHFL